ncbi:cupin domain-containing protein [Deminuibacter soli]|uniref:Uncharacterized protein n=1 Tax=Deminuibacter soli TaxID=2291815 RepID=A0A3E1NE74_9BACT|nr:AraC family ligand binding domain-containing protein [Deminuibacter soli]RFM26144.1 hypothetical protein DXN05_21310 [Deminuibacter soli]
MIKAYKLYTGEDGHSHVISGYVEQLHLSEAIGIRFQETEAHSHYDWHTAPDLQYVITLTGTLEFTCKNECFTIHPGDVLIALDTTGSGHKWQLIDNAPWKRAYVLFENPAKINFIPGE